MKEGDTNKRRARDMHNRRIKEAFEDGSVIDEAMNHAFYAAVRLHRMHRIPLVLWEDGQVCYVDPYEILLPGEHPSLAGENDQRSRRE